MFYKTYSTSDTRKAFDEDQKESQKQSVGVTCNSKAMYTLRASPNIMARYAIARPFFEVVRVSCSLNLHSIEKSIRFCTWSNQFVLALPVEADRSLAPPP
jgi:hypothetical protein